MKIFQDNGFFFDTGRADCLENECYLLMSVRGHSTGFYPSLPASDKSVQDYVDYINDNRIERVAALIDDFSFLKDCQSIRRLDIYPSFEAHPNVSMEGVYQLKNLQLLQVHTVYGLNDRHYTHFDCAMLKSAATLEWFSANCRKGITNFQALNALKSLIVSNYKHHDLTSLIGSNSLDTLSILNSNISSLKGLDISDKVAVIRIEDCHKLDDISTLSYCADTLKGLLISDCNRIKDYSPLSSLHHLVRLTLWGSGSIDNLSFVKDMPLLKTITLGVNVQDGDLSPLDSIESVSIYPFRRHYNRKQSDYTKKNNKPSIRGDEGIEAWRRHVLS